MEELYTNLDDYEEVNAIEELRNENKNLKLKVDEYAIAMEKLQKIWVSRQEILHTQLSEDRWHRL